MLPENKEGRRQGPVTREDPSPDEVYREIVSKKLMPEENEASQTSQPPEEQPKVSSQP